METSPPLARREIIASRIDSGSAVVANELAIEFDVSEDAIRRDLRALAAAGRARRVYGGALPISPANAPMRIRIDENADRKQALAAAAITSIRPGEVLFLDSGSTNLALARLLPAGLEIRVATNSVAIAGVVLQRADIALTVIGGAVDPDVGGCVDSSAIHAVRQYNFDRTFLGACAISHDEGIGAFHGDDAGFKRALIEVSRHVVVMATSEKLDTRAHHRVADLGRIDRIVLEHDAPSTAPRLLAAIGSKAVLAAPVT
ncbi:MAG: DeoR/GlpR family DNA-binding transcription regulator [Novosphingobium sp.]